MKPRTSTALPCPSAILWDMDGTLIDQTAAIIRCYGEVITKMGYPTPADDVIRRSLGGTMAETMGLFVDAARLDEAGKAFRARFPEIMFDGLIVLPGGLELIERAYKARIPQALFTNKHGDTARKVSRYAGFAKYIPVCVGSVDTEWQKPQRELTEHVLQQIDAAGAGAVMIGDSPTDVAVAQNAGLKCYGVATGAHAVSELLAAGAAAAFESLIELNQSLQIPSGT
ncbi:HAD family hydrolase [Coraliomargarita algicola]|uniref:phosphoglycolate phosphatase n=1 Tax=Coraliomargarita algicola TaxID=3092156 RepID=A0ABZ0RN17_9BACT|nr:HAD family hydrolase [Coraliomargarita sp. J2-16]WPJ96385.1 HAD family hydrolase [Coraliomargarita sp. J2-16]